MFRIHLKNRKCSWYHCYHLGANVRKPAFLGGGGGGGGGGCVQQRGRLACASAQSYQHSCYLLIG